MKSRGATCLKQLVQHKRGRGIGIFGVLNSLFGQSTLFSSCIQSIPLQCFNRDNK